MLKNALLFLITALLIPIITKAEWIPLDRSKAAQTPPKVTLLSNNPTSSVIKIELSGFELKDFQAGRTTYQSVDLMSKMFTTEAGLPELPYLDKILAVPDQASISVEVLETGQISTFKDIYLAPARESWYEGDAEPPYSEDADAFRSDRLYPSEPARVEEPAVFRDFRIARVSVFPVRYNASKKELQVASSITVRVNYGNGKAVNPRTAKKTPIAPSFAALYRSFIFNYEEVLKSEYAGREEGHDLVLCIMPDDFYNSFQIYAEWKRQSGIDSHMTKFIEIGGNTNNPDVIKEYIAEAYHNWEIPPTYVLIVGDDGVFPKKIVTYPDYSFPNEDFFVEIDGDDYFPEMMIGRFTNQGDYRMQVMINKFMLYEKTPNIMSTDWYKKGTVCSNNAYESQPETKRYARSMMMSGGFTSVDTLMSDGGYGGDCTYDLDDVIDAINEGRSFLNYRGEGWSDGWHANCYYFSTSDVSSLNNGDKFTFVTSIGCGVAMFDTYGANNCFGEEWIEQGSLTAPKGGIAFCGPTSNTHTTYNNKIDKGIYTGMFQEGVETPGQALLRGKLYMYNVYGNDYYTQYHFKIYCVLGDPSIHIWKDVPRMVNVTHPSTILIGPNLVEVTVTYTAGGSPAAGAQVTLTSDQIFTTGYCDAAGKAYLNIASDIPDTLTVTVRGGDVYPHQSEIIIYQPEELVTPEGTPVVTDLDGNNDGLVNPNENASITYTLKNWGSQTANNVRATLSAVDPEYIEITTTSPVSFGSLAAGADYTGNPFGFFISPECPVGEIISLKLQIDSDEDSWDYYYNLVINGCDIVVYSFMINDQGSPEPNYRMDPGETVLLFINLQNQGNDVAPDVVGMLSGNDPYITIEDSSGSYGTIQINGIKYNSPNFYIVTVDPSCPTNYLANYHLNLSTYNGLYPYRKSIDFTIPVSKPIASDFTGPDTYGYYAYSSDDYFDQAPDYSWFEIDAVGNHINMGTAGDYTETVTIPFTFKYYGIEYNQLRISTDGWVALGPGSQTASINYNLPHNDNINNMIAGFWDDLYDAETVEGDIYYYYDNANHRFIVEWDSIARNDFGSEPNIEIFQAVLYDPDYYITETGDGEIVFMFKKVMAPYSCTIGIENLAQNIGLQYLYNGVYDPTASLMMNEFAIKFTTEPPFATIITGLDEGGPGIAEHGYGLEQNQPNPFTTETRISYVIPDKTQVSLKVYGINGSLICTLQNGSQQAGSYTVTWDGRNDAGQQVSSGVYFYQLKTQDFESTRKMFILR